MVVAHGLSDQSAASKSTAYGELGDIHDLLGNHDQAIACLEHKLKAAR